LDDFPPDDVSETGITSLSLLMESFAVKILLKQKIINMEQLEIKILNENGRFSNFCKEWSGRLFNEISDDLIYQLNQNGCLFDTKMSNLSRVECECGQIKMNKINDHFTIDIEQMKDKLTQINEEINWKPSNVKNNMQSLLELKEFAISKIGFFGTPVPIWTNENKTEIVCIGSISELEKLSGKKIQNIRKEDVDSILIPSKDGNSFLKRVHHVLNSYFEEGSSFHAHLHYPFENESQMKPKDLLVHFISQYSNFPFYSILVHAALFDQSPWKNVFLCHKMENKRNRFSRVPRNQLDWILLQEEHGSEALRLYLLDTLGNVDKPVHIFDKNLNFLKKNVIIPLSHVFDFLIENGKLFNEKNETKINEFEWVEPSDLLDQWILSESNQLSNFIHFRLQKFEIKFIAGKLTDFLENIRNWFIRLNKEKLRGNNGKNEWKQSLIILRELCLATLIVISPLIPNFTEFLYSHLKEFLPKKDHKESIHFFKFPKVEQNNEEIGKAFNEFKIVLKNGRRLKESLPFKSKISQMILCVPKENIEIMESMKYFISRELLVKDINIVWNFEPMVQLKATSILKKFFSKYKKISNCNQQLSKLTHEDLVNLINGNKLALDGVEVFSFEMNIKRKCVKPSKDYIFIEFDDSIILISKE
jgi:isoleucyl-tRNA synthetase